MPLLQLSAHTTILSTTARTVLSQSFINDTKGTVKECRYGFPIYDGVSVVGFACQIGDRTIEGVVKEKKKAKDIYEQATSKGQTAWLLAQGPTSDVFSINLGNIPAGATIAVKVTYIGELKFDVSAQCTKFCIPTSIAPRYDGTPSYPQLKALPSNFAKPDGNGMQITVDINMGSTTFIREVRSPSHPIAVKLGSTSSTPSTEMPQMSQASATLSQGSTDLDKDFNLEIVNETVKQPRALLETYVGDPRQRALMVTFVPEIALATAKPEVIIIADRSGSMRGGKITTLVRALKIFLRSLPVGIYFNICSFGSNHSLLWDKSVVYGEESLALATKHVDGFAADFGGTETLAAVRASIESRDVRQDLAIILCTDGDIWQQQELFTYLNTQVRDSERPIRVFPLGIGNAVSSGLIEGVARAGKGFASTVGEHEKLDGKIVRMLKGALTEKIADCTFDIEYGQEENEDDEEFVLVEHVTDSLSVISLDDFENSTLKDSTEQMDYHSDVVPALAVPKFLQAPQDVPPLYPSIRFTIYVMMSSNAPQKQPVSVILKGTSCQGPVEYKIPVEKIPQPGETIHQLAARKAVGELEEDRGWLVHAKDENGTLLTDKFGAGTSSTQFGAKPKSPKFDEMAESEAVRLGVQYQVGGKFCSFVAVEGDEVTAQPGNVCKQAEPTSRGGYGGFSLASASPNAGSGIRISGGWNAATFTKSRGSHGSTFLSASTNEGYAVPCSTRGWEAGTAPNSWGVPTLHSASTTQGRPIPTSTGGRNAGTEMKKDPLASSERRNHSMKKAKARAAPSRGMENIQLHGADSTQQFGTLLSGAGGSRGRSGVAQDPLDIIISLQRFQGFWELEQKLLNVCGVTRSAATSTILAKALSDKGSQMKVWATIIAITFLERKMAGEKETWELVVDKAKGWLHSNGVEVAQEMERNPLKALLSGV